MSRLADELRRLRRRVAAPLPILGLLAEALFLRRYMRMLLRERNTVIKQLAESNDWKRYLPVPTTPSITTAR